MAEIYFVLLGGNLDEIHLSSCIRNSLNEIVRLAPPPLGGQETDYTNYNLFMSSWTSYEDEW